MTTSRFNRLPIALAIGVIIFLNMLWHSRDKIPENPRKYIKGNFKARQSFYDIGVKYGTDKVTQHHYERMYEHYLAPLRDQPIKMLEIGLGCDMWYGPGASYHTWLEYFSNVDLFFIEYDIECVAKWANETSEASIFTGDQADPVFLEQFLIESGGDFDIIIDDGGHTMTQQRTSLEHLWDSLKPGGVYFIEDLCTSYIEAYEGGMGMSDTFMGDIKSILDDMNKYKERYNKHRVSKNVERLEFTQECVALIKTKDEF